MACTVIDIVRWADVCRLQLHVVFAGSSTDLVDEGALLGSTHQTNSSQPLGESGGAQVNEVCILLSARRHLGG
jgi:hypothetical protein